MHVLFLNPKNNLPVIVNYKSREYMELSCMGYVPYQTGTKKELEETERDITEQMYIELELNEIL